MAGDDGQQAGGRARQRRAEARANPRVLLLIGLLPMFFFALVPLPFLTAFEHGLSDQRMRLRNAAMPRTLPGEIRLVGVGIGDEQRLDEDLRTRQAYHSLMTLMRRWGAHTIAFDLFFDSPRAKDDFLAHALAAGNPRSVLATSFRSVPLGLEPLGELPAELVEANEAFLTGEDAAELALWMADLADFEEALRDWLDAHGLATVGAGEDGARRETLRQLAWTRHLRQEIHRKWFVLTQGIPAPITTVGEPFEAADVRLLAGPLARAAGAIGFANVEKGAEDIVRRAPLLYEYEGRVFPHLSLAAALAWYETPFSEVKIRWGRHLSFEPRANHPGGGTIRIPIDERGRYLVNFREGEAFLNRHPTLSAVILADFREALLGADEEVAPGWRNAIVLVGEVISGGEATDLEPIPLQPQFPMVGLHANILGNILDGDFLRVPGAGWRLGVHVLLGLLITAGFFLLPFPRAAPVAGVLAVGYLAGQFLAFLLGNLVLPMVTPMAGALVSTLGFFGYLVVVKDRDRRLVREVFLKSVSPRVGEEILRNYHDEAIWGAQREITVLFIDIRGYTTLSERRGPAVVLEVLEKFYDTVSESVFRHDGQVNKFLGDAVLALFGALPEEPPHHAERAARAVAEIQAAIAVVNASPWGREIGVELNTGAGVHTGVATVGLVGRRELRIEYTALGDAVNVASRLQNLASHGEVIFSEAVLSRLTPAAPEFFSPYGLRLAPPESVQVKGRAQPVTICKALPAKDTP